MLHLVIIWLSFTKANSYSNVFTHPPLSFGGIVLCYVSIKSLGDLPSWLSLCCDFSQAFGIACVWPSYSFGLPHSSGAISEACVILCATGLCPPFIRPSCSCCLILACVLYLVVWLFLSRIVTLSCDFVGKQLVTLWSNVKRKDPSSQNILEKLWES